MKVTKEQLKLFRQHAGDILESDNFRHSRTFTQHGSRSVKAHSISVALVALAISRKLPFEVDEKELIRGALLHDYFLYDWHEKPEEKIAFWQFYKLHGFTHPFKALNNAKKEFEISKKEEDIIKKHMWPLTVIPPTCREAWIVTMADKYCALAETFA